MAENNYLTVEGSENIILNDIHGSTININSKEAIEAAIKNATAEYITILKSELSSQKELLTNLNTQFVQILEQSIENRVLVLNSKNTSTAPISAGGNVNLGDTNTTYNSDPIEKIRIQITTYLKIGNLSEETERRFKEWNIDLLARNIEKIPMIASEFAKEEAKILNKGNKSDFTIWLNRYSQKRAYKKKIQIFKGREEAQSPFIFGVMGSFKNDCLTEATKMLQKYYFDKILNDNEGHILDRRSDEDLELLSCEDAKYEYENVLETVLEKVRGDTLCQKYPELLENEYAEYHIIVRCGIRDWNKEGLNNFFKLWNDNIKRNPKLPFILLLEFEIGKETELEIRKELELEEVFKSEIENNSLLLLPKLTQISERDILAFYALELKVEGETQCYRDIFISDENSLCTEHAELCYNEAIAKLKLK